MKITSFLFATLGLLLSFCGLTAAPEISIDQIKQVYGAPDKVPTGAEQRRHLTAPQGEPLSDLDPNYKEGELLTLEWGSGTNQVTLDALFDGEKVSMMRFTDTDGREYTTPNIDRDGITMKEDEISIFQKVALNARKGWRTVGGLDGVVAYETEPYTLISVTKLPFEDFVLVFKRGEAFFAIPYDFWVEGYSRPDLGAKVLIGRSGDKFCEIKMVHGSPKVPEEMLRHLRREAEEANASAKK